MDRLILDIVLVSHNFLFNGQKSISFEFISELCYMLYNKFDYSYLHNFYIDPIIY